MPINFTVNYDALTNNIRDADGDINATPVYGPMWFSPSVEAELYVGTYTPRPTGVTLRRFDGYIDIDGRLKNKPNGTPGVRLWANDPIFGLPPPGDTQKRSLHYQVSAELTDQRGRTIQFVSFKFEAPATDTTINLVTTTKTFM